MAVDPVREMFRLFEIRPDEVDRAVWEFAGGSAASAVADGILEGNFRSNPEYWANRFPYLPMPIFPDILPPLDDTLVAVAGPIVAALGAFAKNKDLFRVGVGLSSYGGPMWLKELVTRITGKILAGGSSPPTSQGETRSVRAKGRYRVTS